MAGSEAVVVPDDGAGAWPLAEDEASVGAEFRAGLRPLLSSGLQPCLESVLRTELSLGQC